MENTMTASHLDEHLRCAICGTSGSVKAIIPKLSEWDYGHLWCSKCRGSFDENALEIRALAVSAEDIAAIESRDDYRKLFVETWEIGDETGDVYTDFDWVDNQALQRGVAAHAIGAIERSGLSGPIDLLDVGCGNGFTTAVMADRFGKERIIGLDPSPMIEQLEARTGVRGIRGTLDTVAFDAGMFDVVIIIGNLMLHSDMAATLREAHRILRPGGIAVIDYKNIDCASRRLARWAAWASGKLAASPLVERNFVNMRFGLARRHLRYIAPAERFELVEAYCKPPRLLEFPNRSEHKVGLAGVAWMALNMLDSLIGQQAWLQFTLRKIDQPGTRQPK